MVKIKSSNIFAINQDNHFLIIQFKNGSIYKYSNAAIHFDDMLNSLSKGKFFHKKIKGKYKYTQIR